jgi:hypothetical protein
MRAIILILLMFGHGLMASDLADYPEELYFKTTWLPHPKMIEYRITADGLVAKTNQPTSSNQASTEKRRITPDAWLRFRTLISALRLEAWKETYNPPQDGSFYYDGYFWEMRLTSDGLATKSSGQNAGPDPTNPEKTVVTDGGSTGADRLLSKAFDNLWENSAVIR